MTKASSALLIVILSSLIFVGCGGLNSLFENREPTKSSGPAPLSGREVGPEEEPDWAQGLELSCNWGSVINVNIVEVNCELISQGELPAELEAVELTPQARGRSGAKWPGAKQVLTLVTESKFIFKFSLCFEFYSFKKPSSHGKKDN